MKLKNAIVCIFLFVQTLAAQEKTAISVFPFQNKTDKKYEWLTYGLSYMVTESMNNTGIFNAVPQDQIHKAVSDPGINLDSVLDGKPNLVFAKYQSTWNTNIFIIGSFTVNADTLIIQARVCNLIRSSCSSPVTVQGAFHDFKGFYFLMAQLTESLYDLLISFDVNLTRDAVTNSRDKTRQLAADYDGYKAYIKSWMALRNYDDGIAASSLNKYEDAVRFFETAKILDESNALNLGSVLSKTYLLRGNQLYGQSKWDEAAGDYTKSIQLNPKSSEAYYNLGNVYKNKKDYDNAITNYRRSLAIDSTNLDAYRNIGFVCMEEGRSSEAVAAYLKALSVDDKKATSHYYAGLAYDKNGDAVNAAKYYRRAIELDNTLAAAHLNLGILLKLQKDLAGARKEYELAVQYDPHNAAAHRNLGILLMNDKKEASLAALYLQKCLELDPDQPDASIIKKNIGILKKKAGKKK
ncbi:tetratricopeptide repeat protein [bacterium]|nr:MAG: tetratricopeptide repeat protein [bacterium]